ncbi:temptin-like [Physella acuta]|uniref:temptin-like n=1 Tax=Physella acuta TaxID=109671 RepID=UPI0027DB4DAE|nr:temptin-like [Physella acuta]
MAWCLRVIAAVCLLLVGVQSMRQFRGEIPNGYILRIPCQNETWEGVGHMNFGGGGELNPFGRDFLAAGKKWTTNLCRLDSDGDGWTNGQELGDPKCQWRVGRKLPKARSITHPGINNKDVKC